MTLAMNEDQEYTLPGGNFDSGVVRVGNAVRRRSGPWTPSVHALLRYLADSGFEAAPVPLGTDGQRCEILSYLDGEAGHFPLEPYMRSDATLASVGSLLRAFHDLTEHFPLPPGAVWQQAAPDPGPVEVVCHNDWAPYNAIFRSQRLVGIIDWDFARPGSRLWDLAWAALTWVPLWNDGDDVHGGRTVPADRSRRLRLLCDAYGLRERRELLPAVYARVLSTSQWLEHGAARGEPVFRRLVDEGHADGYRRAAHQIEGEWALLEAAL